MGRYYQTSERNFVNDFVYQPPWEMAMAVAQKKNADAQNSLDTIELMRDLPVKYWKGMDDARAEAVKSKWNTRVDELAGSLQKNLLNPENRSKLLQLKRDLSKDTMSGDIAKLQANANAFEQFEARRQALKNPGDRQAYLKMIEDYRTANPDGAFTSTFKPDEMYDRRNLLNEYTQSDAFKALKPDEIAEAFDKSNGQYNIKQSVMKAGLGSTKLGANFLAWMNGEGLEGYAQNAEKYFGQKWFGSDGQFDFSSPDSYLAQTLAGVGTLAYSKEHKDFDKSADQFALQQQSFRNQVALENLRNSHEMARQRQAAALSAMASGSSDPNKDTGFFGTETPVKVANVLKASQDLQNMLNGYFGKMGAHFSGGSYGVYQKILSDPSFYQSRFPEAYKNALTLKKAIDDKSRASRQFLVDKFGRKEADRIDKNFSERLDFSTKMHLDIQGGGVSGKQFSMSQMGAQGFQVWDAGANKYTTVQPGSLKFVDGVQYIPSDDINNRGNTIAVKTINFKDISGSDHSVRAYIPIKNVTGLK